MLIGYVNIHHVIDLSELVLEFNEISLNISKIIFYDFSWASEAGWQGRPGPPQFAKHR